MLVLPRRLLRAARQRQSQRPGTAFFGGPEDAGGFDGFQAEKARIPYANVGLVKLPDQVSDDQAILISDIFPTGYQFDRRRPGWLKVALDPSAVTAGA